MKRDKLVILFVSANPARDLDVDSEYKEIQESIKKAKYRDFVSLELCLGARYEDLIEAMNSKMADIIYFSGHGVGDEGLIFLKEDSTDSITINKGTLKEQKIGIEKVSANRLRELFKTANSNLKLVIINACHSIEQAKEIIESVDFAIGMEGAIKDKDAIDFAKVFFHSFASNVSLEDSFIQAKSASGENPILFKRDDASDFRLLEIVDIGKNRRLIYSILTILVLLVVYLFSLSLSKDNQKTQNGNNIIVNMNKTTHSGDIIGGDRNE